MNLSAITGTGMPIGGMPAAASSSASPGVSGASDLFNNLIDRFVGEANVQQIQADQSVQDLALGKTDSMHQVLLEVAKADLAFRLVLEVRNRLTEAYQEIAKMPL